MDVRKVDPDKKWMSLKQSNHQKSTPKSQTFSLASNKVSQVLYRPNARSFNQMWYQRTITFNCSSRNNTLTIHCYSFAHALQVSLSIPKLWDMIRTVRWRSTKPDVLISRMRLSSGTINAVKSKNNISTISPVIWSLITTRGANTPPRALFVNTLDRRELKKQWDKQLNAYILSPALNNRPSTIISGRKSRL